MSTLRIDGMSYSLYIKNIEQSSSMQEETREYYADEPFGSASYPKFRRIVINFVIYDTGYEDIARDLEAQFRNSKQFLIWIEECSIIQGFKYILAKPDKINIPRDSGKPNHIEGTLTIDVLGLGGDFGYSENNYVRVKYLENVWNLEGAS